MIAIYAILIFILAYFYGGFSTARMIAKTFRSLNINKVGSGLADTENIYTNISKPMGILVGGLDIAKAFIFLKLVEFFLLFLQGVPNLSHIGTLYNPNLMLGYGMGMLLGHCLPPFNHFRGGRGIFTYMGFFAYFAFYPMLITALLAWLLVSRFKQMRFAQYMIVILPVVLFQIFYHAIPGYRQELPQYFVSIMLGNALFMGILNIIVSKRLGEF